MFGAQNPSVSKALAMSLADVINDETIIIASTDLSHYHSSKEAESMDRKLIEDIKSKDTGTFYNDIKHSKTEACGFSGIMTLMYLANPLDISSFTELYYTHSGIASGDYNQVVGYLSAVLTQG
jgi:AmmeMemoRadiSam system protein B